MSLTLLIVFITAVVSGIGFWFYNRRQISSLAETLEDKNAVINSLRGHIESPTSTDNSSVKSKQHQLGEKKKKRYSNRPKKKSNGEPKTDGGAVKRDQKEKSGRGRKPKN
jgi:hypothetical protein